MLIINPIPAFRDNYIWLIANANSPYALVVDPGDANPVLTALKEKNLALAGILLTHHHPDHSGGVAGLLAHYSVPVFGSANEKAPGISQAVCEPMTVAIPVMGLEFKVLDIPGHTRGHIAFLGHGRLFCGDTLFTGGCGRVFEGTPSQMYQTLGKLAALPEETLIYCGHEYTVANLRFAQQIEPNNPLIKQRLENALETRAQQLATVPASLELEKQTNPFLRCHLPEVKTAAEHYAGHSLPDPAQVFAKLREWKNQIV